MFPAKDKLTICFAHVAYAMQDQFAKRGTGIKSFQVRSYEEFEKRVGEADVVVASGMWKNDIIPKATNLKFIQSISAGMDQYSKELLGAKGVRLCSASGVNARAVAEHAIALMLALARKLPQARDNQIAGKWRGMISEIAAREDELGGKTLAIVGMGRIGSRTVKRCVAFEMDTYVLDPNVTEADIKKAGATKVTDLKAVLPRIDYVSVHCPKSPETVNMFNAETLALMKPEAFLVNTARGGIVNEDALYDALSTGKLRGAGLDVLDREPPDPKNKLFTLENVIFSPHMAGVTQEASDRMAVTAVENILSVFDGRVNAANVVNKEVLS